MRIVFMGTPDFSVGSLKALYEAGHEIVGVFTQPDKPKGRKMVLTPPPVKVYAESIGAPVFQPKSVKTDEAFKILEDLNPELIAVVAYGKILPKAILDYPKFGCINVHASLLPRHRGSSPIQYSIYCGDKETGVTTMLMDEGVDTGDMLLVSKTEISKSDNYETLHDRLSLMGADLLVKTVSGLKNGTVKPIKQPSEGVTHAPMITKEMGLIDFSKSARKIDCQIRAFTPWPSAYFFIDGVRVKVLLARIGAKTNKPAGTVICNKGVLSIATSDGDSIDILNVQPEGKSAMEISAYLNGKQIELGANL